MSDSAMAHSLFAHVQKIVELQQEVAATRERKDEAARTLRSLEQQTRDLEQQLKNAKQLLNHCIDTAQDPIAAQLSGSFDEAAVAEKNTDFDVINSYYHQIFTQKLSKLNINDLLLPTIQDPTRNKI